MERAQTRGEPPLGAKQTVALGLVAVFLIAFLGSLLIYGFNIAMPMIAAGLKGMAWYSWAISLPALAAAFVTLLFGKLSDMYGRRPMEKGGRAYSSRFLG
jgi:MFS family permease